MNRNRFTVSAGDFQLIYDPSVGEAEPWYINDHTFVLDHTGKWHLIGITHAEPANPLDELHLAHATAPALHGPWTKQPFALSTDRNAGESHLWAPHVIRHDDRYWMFVCAGGKSPTEYRIHLATSDDCIVWSRHPANPLVVDGFCARDPMVLRVDDRWVMYYTATLEPAAVPHIVAAAESDDLVHWSGRRIVFTDERVGTRRSPADSPTESPFVVERDSGFYLLTGPFPPSRYRGTRVLWSDDPFSFRVENQVGYIDAHAAEVVVDAQGKTWISHCGWRQGGVFLAPLEWV